VIRCVILIAAVAPSLLILTYWLRKTGVSWTSEALWSAFFLGALGVFGALGIELAIDQLDFPGGSLPVISAASRATFVAAIPEEAVKFFLLVVLVEKHVDVRRFQDVMVLGLTVSLGFATAENFFYVTSLGDWKTVAGLRALTAVPAHGLNGLAMGALLISARLDGVKGNSPRELWLVRSALIVPMLLHAAYDFPLFAMGKHLSKVWFGTVWLLAIVLSWIFVVRLFNRVLARAAFADMTSPHSAASKANIRLLMQSGSMGLMTRPFMGQS
jgi:RsiW-degrading membrane proteinase PrsW (M82 family)